ncbi:citrate synthase [Spirochaetota bacterium]
MADISKKIEKLSLAHDSISPELARKKDIKFGLRNRDGTGVVVGVTTKGKVEGYTKIDKEGKTDIKPSHGKLFYCGYDVANLIDEITAEGRFGFEEIIYLLLAGQLPGKNDLKQFNEKLGIKRNLSKAERGIILEEAQTNNQMHDLHFVISHMSRSDITPDSTDVKDVIRQCINLIAKFPTIVAYNYHAMKYRKGSDLKMMRPRPELSAAENFLYMLKCSMPDSYDARLLDTSLILHAEHGGGNNSTFAVRTVSSSGANTYMAIASGIASLSGQFHGGANQYVMQMMKHLKKNVKDWGNERAITKYLQRLLDGKVNNVSGKIYGLGHAVYTLSDPRAVILKKQAEEYSKMKGLEREFQLYNIVEKIGTKLISERKRIKICVNVDFYSGFLYKMLGIPPEIYTPMFAMARVAGWSAHRIEQLIQGKIMRPAYMSLSDKERKYKNIKER